MSVVWTTIKRELLSYLFSPVGYLIAVLLYLYRGIEVSALVKRVAAFGGDVDQLATAYVLQPSGLIMIVLVPPILTMRCFAEERRSGSLEVLLTAPVRSWEIVLGKWGASLAFYALLWGPTLIVLLVLGSGAYLAADLPFSTVLSGYLGLVLVGALMLAAGCFTSSLTDNVLLASLAGILFGYGLLSGPAFLTPHLANLIPQFPWVATLLGQINVVDHLQTWFARGVVDTGHCVFYVAGTACFLFLTERAQEYRRMPALRGRAALVLAGLLALAVWAGATLLATRPALRTLIDVSPQAQFTFDAATLQLLQELRDRDLVLEIDSFYEPLQPRSDAPEDLHMFGLQKRVQELTTDLLRLYAVHGGPAVKLTHHDLLREVKAARERAERFSLRVPNSVVVSVGKRHKALSLELDLATIDFPAIDRTPTPGAAQRHATLELYKGEEAISSAVRSLLVEGTPRCYFLRGFGEITIQAGVADSYSELAVALTEEGFAVDFLPLREKGHVPDDAAVVALLEPRYEISEREGEALLAYLRRGGRLLLNFSFREQPEDHNPTFAALTRSLGFTVGTDVVGHLVPDPNMPQAPGVGGPRAQSLVTKLDPNHPVTAPLVRASRALFMAAARELTPEAKPPDGVHVDDGLLRTGPWAWLAPRRDTPGRPVDWSAPRVQSAYAERCIGAVVDVDPTSGDRPGRAIVLGGLAFLNGGGFQSNGDFALNAFNWLAERRELVTVRGTRHAARKLELVPQQSERVDRLVVWYAPGALLAIALVVFWRRRRI